jgi:mycothiol synthase
MRLRAPVIADAAAVAEVLRARDIADAGEPDYTRGDLLQEWRRRDVDLAADARVAELDGRIVAYGAVRRLGAMIAVEPRFRRGGIGRALVAWAERRERERGRDVHRQWLGAADVELRNVLTESGYTPVRSYFRMVRGLTGVEDPGPAPDGIRFRPLDLELDAVAVHALDDLSFSAVADYTPTSLEQFREEHLSDLDPGLSVIAETRDGGMAGFLLARVWREPGAGFIDVLAVQPARQGRGLGSALLRHGFAAFAGAGLREAQLGVASDNPRAFALYERVGMRQKFRFDVYERPAG